MTAAKKISHHFYHYLPLIAVLTAGALGFLFFRYDREFQFVIALATATSYFSWGLIHHKIHKDLHASVIVEYLLIAALGIVISYSLLFRP